MNKIEYDAILERVADDTLDREHYDPLMNVMHVLYPGRRPKKLIPTMNLHDASKKGVYRYYYEIMQKTRESDDLSYGEAISDLKQEYHNLMRAYLTTGKMYELGLYPVRFYEMKALSSIDPTYETVCLWLSKEDIGWRDNIVVVSNGNIEVADFKGNRHDLPNDYEFVFLIDMSIYRRVVQYEKRSDELRFILSYFKKGERK